MSGNLSLRVRTEIEELRRIDEAVEKFGAGEDWPPNLLFQVKLALEELAINVMNHGHDDDGEHEMEITLTSETDKLTIELSDDGRAFNPLDDAPEPDLDAALEDRPIGGLGVHMVRTFMDEMSYRRDEGKNHLTLIKRRDG